MLWLSGKSTSPRTAVWPTLHWISLRYQRHKPTLNGFFLVCGMLSQGHRNGMSKSLEMRVWLKLNVKLIFWLGWQTFYLLYSDFDYIRRKTFSIFFTCVSTAFLTWLVWTTWLISTIRSAVVLRTRTQFGRRTFSVCGPDIWNSLPVNIRLIDSHPSFRRAIKSHLFNIAFS